MNTPQPEPHRFEPASGDGTGSASGDGTGSASGDGSGPASGDGAGTSSGDGTESSSAGLSRQRLLAEVLGETLSRKSEDPAGLLAGLQHLKATWGGSDLAPERMPEVVRAVLRQRLGDKAGHLPPNLLTEVGEVLWEDPTSRARIERLWASITSDPATPPERSPDAQTRAPGEGPP